jgi:KDPG/KHG aldolase
MCDLEVAAVLEISRDAGCTKRVRGVLRVWYNFSAMAQTFLTNILDHRLVPVIELDSADDASFLAEALLQGGLPVIELTFRTAAAAQAIVAVRKTFPEMIVGAGTVVLRKPIEAGHRCRCAIYRLSGV